MILLPSGAKQRLLAWHTWSWDQPIELWMAWCPLAWVPSQAQLAESCRSHPQSNSQPHPHDWRADRCCAALRSTHPGDGSDGPCIQIAFSLGDLSQVLAWLLVMKQQVAGYSLNKKIGGNKMGQTRRDVQWWRYESCCKGVRYDVIWTLSLAVRFKQNWEIYNNRVLMSYK